MKLSEELVWRGMVAEHTFGDDFAEELDGGPRKFYLGVDPSASSMTIGNLAALMMAKCFMRHGYEATLLAGGATGQIGDPKETGERGLKTLEEIDENVRGIEAQFKQITGEDFRLVNNADWFSDMKFLPFLREIFKQFSVTQMLDRKFVQDRIGEGGSGISLAEFCYTTIQGYDFLHLYREFGIDLQLCGADQFGNCVSGMQLIRKLEDAKADVWSTPLVIDPVSRKKFGKSEGNAIWLSAERTGVFDFYQFWLNQSDEAVLQLLKIYTLLEKEEIEEIMVRHGANMGERLAQRALAFGATDVVHGKRNAMAAERASEILFSGEKGMNDEEWTRDSILLAEVMSSYELGIKGAGDIIDGGGAGDEQLIDVMVASGLTISKGEARRLISGGGVALNGEKITDADMIAKPGVLKVGKNKFLVIK